ncbi:Hypothetical predicted protein [Mytilus galloprovincialis]|uniref:Uncharacterized protein n=1 Tax=Mytilus galloprovincialis TaxID=29158 RepID=A0A8B6E4R4_MYTGA|nr:Hypothetical predicted protein [Mytilus galloprovincialis]
MNIASGFLCLWISFIDGVLKLGNDLDYMFPEGKTSGNYMDDNMRQWLTRVDQSCQLSVLNGWRIQT